ncbi:MAG TPA: FGGY-family carbohydrate kinase [Streptosporangiaceae bacterium]|nr:FGGY-family carbohydrate kinase [Streptosporangiaceae bacterium]
MALDTSGEAVARASAGYPTSRPGPGAAEQDPASWIGALGRAVAELAAGAPPGQWRAIGLSAMIPTLVTADAAGHAVGAAITWEDSRAEGHAARLRAAAGDAALYERTGQRVDGRYLLPMFLRLRDREPDRAAATRTLLGAKDYLFWWLTGEAVTDPSTATGFGAYSLSAGDWDAGILAAAASLAGGDLPALPPVLPTSAVRSLRATVAARLGCPPIPVCVGAADSVLGALGLGARTPGQVAYVAGTSTVILGLAAEPRLEPRRRFLVTPMAEPSVWGQEMDVLATGSAVRWLADVCGLEESAVMALAAEVDPAEGPVMLPYLSPGEQGALWDPALRGTIAGLTLGHRRRHLARGLVNGIVLESRRCLAVLEEAGTDGVGQHGVGQHDVGQHGVGQHGAAVLVAGRGAASAAFRADLADATGRRVIGPGGHDADFSARGAALLAARAVGRTVPDAPAGCSVTEPDPGRAAAWDLVWAEHERVRLAVSQRPRTAPGAC